MTKLELGHSQDMFDNSTPVRSKQKLKDNRKITNKGNREKLVFNPEPEAEGSADQAAHDKKNKEIAETIKVLQETIQSGKSLSTNDEMANLIHKQATLKLLRGLPPKRLGPKEPREYPVNH